eukprot:UN32477
MKRKKEYTLGETITGRIMFVCYKTKAISVSLLDHLVYTYQGANINPKTTKAGSFHKAKIYKVGLTELMCTLLGSNYDARCTLAQISDDDISSIQKEEYLDETKKCRILSTNLCDGLINITLKPSILERRLLYFNDAKVT